MEHMLEALVFGTFWFWASCTVVFVIILALSENERNVLAFISFVGFMILMNAAGNIKFGEILSHPLQLLMWLTIYFAIGTVWSIVKWFSKLHQKHDQYLEFKEKFVKEHTELGLDLARPIPDDSWDEFATELVASGYHPNPSTTSSGYYPSRLENPTREDLKPNWRAWKGRLAGWILWWPTSAFWTILNDPLVRLANWIRDRFRHVYSKIADRTFRDV